MQIAKKITSALMPQAKYGRSTTKRGYAQTSSSEVAFGAAAARASAASPSSMAARSLPVSRRFSEARRSADAGRSFSDVACFSPSSFSASSANASTMGASELQKPPPPKAGRPSPLFYVPRATGRERTASNVAPRRADLTRGV